MRMPESWKRMMKLCHDEDVLRWRAKAKGRAATIRRLLFEIRCLQPHNCSRCGNRKSSFNPQHCDKCIWEMLKQHERELQSSQ